MQYGSFLRGVMHEYTQINFTVLVCLAMHTSAGMAVLPSCRAAGEHPWIQPSDPAPSVRREYSITHVQLQRGWNYN